MAEKLALVDYGAGNLHSVENALRAAGAEDVTVTSDPNVVRAADRIVLPGVGAFAACARALRGVRGLVEAMTERVHVGGAPFLGICVGMQLLYEGSEEAPEVPGLGLLEGHVERLRTELPLPHVGWNAVEWVRAAEADPVLEGVAGPEPRYFYHVHSYAAQRADAPEVLGRCTYDVAFASVVRRNNVWGIQFHPEKSQAEGLRILHNFARA